MVPLLIFSSQKVLVTVFRNLNMGAVNSAAHIISILSFMIVTLRITTLQIETLQLTKLYEYLIKSTCI
jgi:hypothetical protein